MKKRALLSVSNKEGIVELAQGLLSLGYEIISSGGTWAKINQAGIPVKSVSELTGFPEMLDGRVKTLHPAIHGAILTTDSDEHLAQCKAQNIMPIEVVVVNLYPFEETIHKPNVDFSEAIENIDIGGPTLIRGAAKNHAHVYVVVEPSQYASLLEALGEEKDEGLSYRRELALAAFSHTAAYDALIRDYLTDQVGGKACAEQFSITGLKTADLRYGENPHQKAAVYQSRGDGLVSARQYQGKELSFNNWMDLQAAMALVLEFEEPACAIIKHMNPCGVALAETLLEAYKRAHEADPVSAFGSVVALNARVGVETAQEMVTTFVEAIIAPSYTEDALRVLEEKKNIRVMEIAPADFLKGSSVDIKTVSGGFLVQEKDEGLFEDEVEWVGNTPPSMEVYADLVFAMKVVKHVKSNAIVTVKNLVTTGIGPGQTNRVGAARIALEMAGKQAKGSVLASDAFFPFRDTVDLAADYGVVAIIQPGGSMRDDESIAACQERGLIMGLTGMRHFKH